MGGGGGKDVVGARLVPLYIKTCLNCPAAYTVQVQSETVALCCGGSVGLATTQPIGGHTFAVEILRLFLVSVSLCFAPFSGR